MKIEPNTLESKFIVSAGSFDIVTECHLQFENVVFTDYFSAICGLQSADICEIDMSGMKVRVYPISGQEHFDEYTFSVEVNPPES